MSSLDLLVNLVLPATQLQASEPAFDDDELICPHGDCRRAFSSKRNLVDHFRGHHQGSKPHICPYPQCGKSFLRPAHKIIHMRTHTGEKPFVCEYPGCGKRWNQKSALKQHLRSHTGEKPFACPFCVKSFSTSSSCKRHILTHDRMTDAAGAASMHNSSDSSGPESPYRDVRPPRLSSRKRKASFEPESGDAKIARRASDSSISVPSSPYSPSSPLSSMSMTDDYSGQIVPTTKMSLSFLLN